MDIFIVSSGRPLKQTTWASLPRSLQERTVVVVPKDEVEQYVAANPGMGVEGCPEFGIGKTRQWVVEKVDGHVAMLDDDLVFATRRTDDPTKFFNSTAKEVEELFENIDACLDNCAHVGVATREGGNRNTERFLRNTRMLRILCYDTPVLKKHNIRFDSMPVMEDFHVTLSLLRKGYENVVFNYMVQNQNGSNLLGGCSQYRTADIQEMGAILLRSKHPQFVKVVKKTTKSAWSDMKERFDVVVQWKKSFNADL